MPPELHGHLAPEEWASFVADANASMEPMCAKLTRLAYIRICLAAMFPAILIAGLVCTLLRRSDPYEGYAADAFGIFLFAPVLVIVPFVVILGGQSVVYRNIALAEQQGAAALREACARAGKATPGVALQLSQEQTFRIDAQLAQTSLFYCVEATLLAPGLPCGTPSLGGFAVDV